MPPFSLPCFGSCTRFTARPSTTFPAAPIVSLFSLPQLAGCFFSEDVEPKRDFSRLHSTPSPRSPAYLPCSHARSPSFGLFSFSLTFFLLNDICQGAFAQARSYAALALFCFTLAVANCHLSASVPCNKRGGVRRFAQP